MKKNNKIEKKAVAIKYLKENLYIPKISAIGNKEFAQQIIMKAKENGIKIVENEEFFEFEKLFRVGREIPAEIYEIVAEILAYILKTND